MQTRYYWHLSLLEKRKGNYKEWNLGYTKNVCHNGTNVECQFFLGLSYHQEIHLRSMSIKLDKFPLFNLLHKYFYATQANFLQFRNDLMKEKQYYKIYAFIPSLPW